MKLILVCLIAIGLMPADAAAKESKTSSYESLMPARGGFSLRARMMRKDVKAKDYSYLQSREEGDRFQLFDQRQSVGINGVPVFWNPHMLDVDFGMRRHK